MRYAITGILVLVFLLFGCPSWLAGQDAPYILRACLYPFFHANVFHLAVNILSVWVLFRRCKPSRLVAAYLIAFAVYPLSFIRPVVGFSNMLFAVSGMNTPSFRDKWWTGTGTLVYIATMVLMGLLPQFSAITHIASFILGTLVAVLVRRCHKLHDDARRAGI